MTLTIAIPVHNDAANLMRLLKDLHALHCAAQIVVVDDHSDEPLQQSILCMASGLDDLILLRSETALGPGAARNLALTYVTTPLVLFLDADDQPTRSLPWLLQDLEDQSFDFCLFQHHDTRMAERGLFGQMPYDQLFWNAAKLPPGALTPLTHFAAAQLVQTSNYPWNKIYNTDFLRNHDISCTEILVHEDIELHWRSFFHGARILASDHIAVIHHVHDTGQRLTNRTGPERLEVFKPLTRLEREIETGGHALYLRPFWTFSIGLLHWIRDNLDADLQDNFKVQARNFIRTHAPETWQVGFVEELIDTPVDALD